MFNIVSKQLNKTIQRNFSTMSPIPKHYDYIAIGGGSGGVASARRAAQYGKKALVIEGKHIGGTCVNVGCVPKKVMWYASDVAGKIAEAKEYGFDVDPNLKKTFNWEYFKPKRDAYIKRLNGIYERNLAKENVDLVYGWGKIVGDKQVEVKTKEGETLNYTADHILIATGGTPVQPNVPGAELGINSDGFFELEKQPKKVAIVGAGYIGVEFAGFFHGLNTETHLIIRGDTVLRKFDDSIQNTITNHYEKIGIHVHKQSNVSNVEKLDSGLKKVTLTNGEILEVDELIWTVGRRSLLGLGLESIGVKVNDHDQVVVDEYQNTNIPNVYSLGDVIGKVELTPVAIAAGRKLSNRLFGPEEFKNDKLDYSNVPSVVFSHPEAGSIGLTEKEAKEQYGENDIKTYNAKFTPMYYAMLEEKSPISYKLVVQGSNEKVVGLHLVGDASAEILQGFGVAIKMGATKKDFDSVVAIHPTSAEELVTLR
ncbi:Glutathione reductase [Wickerhamomyces ciferrii]|uniref:Glutathione reductase n=1 Tax=Wickerhamomyces ciferrii (strain ATCC 14091 / BCRC 22168 / CBS 111 / JCM 3599 / NBRC 0793 / NRRL Y-1031 F-60-10) TaxID=1206466 RepID=K0KHS2_WICCF|nr:Glutathione reductase [Wickerhamomyces ciferrii]CCH40708.1 Glutathione reductase [Wickerhamomyces ciferrii]